MDSIFSPSYNSSTCVVDVQKLAKPGAGASVPKLAPGFTQIYIIVSGDSQLKRVGLRNSRVRAYQMLLANQ